MQILCMYIVLDNAILLVLYLSIPNHKVIQADVSTGNYYCMFIIVSLQFLPLRNHLGNRTSTLPWYSVQRSETRKYTS